MNKRDEEKQLPDLEYCQELKRLGYKQEGIYFWQYNGRKRSKCKGKNVNTFI